MPHRRKRNIFEKGRSESSSFIRSHIYGSIFCSLSFCLPTRFCLPRINSSIVSIYLPHISTQDTLFILLLRGLVDQLFLDLGSQVASRVFIGSLLLPEGWHARWCRSKRKKVLELELARVNRRIGSSAWW